MTASDAASASRTAAPAAGPTIQARYAAEQAQAGAGGPAASPAWAAMVPALNLMVSLVSAAVIVAALYFGRDILMPLALAFLLGFVLDPLVGRLRRWHVPRVPAVALVVLFALGLLISGGFFLGQQVKALSAELPTYQSNIMGKMRSMRETASQPGVLDGVVKTIDAVKKEVDRASAEPAAAPSAPRSASAPQRVQIEAAKPTPLQQAMHWLDVAIGPLATAGIVLVFVVLVLLDRLDLRDRLLRLWGGNLHRSTDAMDEAGARIGRYLTMQLVVNLSYGIPMALGLWLIGVPGALLWGAVAAVTRFVPYVGPMISAVFPLALAFAVDPGWSMVLWVVALIAVLELVSNNLVEPWLYGASTGLSAMSLMVAATFWTALWGPVGLIMSTPLTVCLLVIGRHLPRLSFLDVLLGSQPALDAPTRLYQRLLADEVEEAIELASEQADEAGHVADFYNATGLPVLRMASDDHARVASVEHRHRLVVGMEALIADLEEQFPSAGTERTAAVACVGGKWEVDFLAARMLAHALALAGHPALHRAPPRIGPEGDGMPDLDGVQLLCLSFFSPEPRVAARHLCRRLRRRWPHLKIVLGLWNAPAELLGEEAARDMRADAVATSIDEALRCVSHLIGTPHPEGYAPAPVPEDDAQRLDALRLSGALDPRAQALFDVASKRAADVFDVPFAMVSLIDGDTQRVQGLFGELPWRDAAAGEDDQRPQPAGAEAPQVPRELSVCGHVVANGQTLVVPDIVRDIRFAGNPVLRRRGVRFYAGAPLRDAGGYVLGTLCVLDTEPRELLQRELRLLEMMAAELMEALRTQVLHWNDFAPLAKPAAPSSSATLGQPVPAGR